MRMKKILFTIIVTALFCKIAYCQTTKGQFDLVDELSKGNESLVAGMIAGFSIWGLIGAILFGGVGFVSFIYGKRNSLASPLIIGILLMVYPYFIHNTAVLYLVGIALTIGLYLTRE